MADNDTDFSSFVSADPAENDTDFSTFNEANLSESPPEASASGFSGLEGASDGPSLGQQAGAALETGARAAYQSAGALAGAGIGAAVSGPFAPIGATVGGALGYWVGGKSAEISGFRSPEDLPAELRPAGYFGESIGGAFPFATAPYVLAAANYKFAPTAVGKFINQIVNTAKTRPITFALAEAGPAISAAAGAGIAESLAPGDTGIRVGAEVAAGMTNPTKGLVIAATGVNQIVRKATSTLSPAARETQAGQYIMDVLAQTGEDPELIARVLRETPLAGLENLTAAQRAGSPGLAAISDMLAKQSSKFGAESEKAFTEGLDAIRQQVALLRGTGDPEALRAAAEVQSTYYRTLIQGRLDMAVDDARAAAAGISQDTPAARAELGVRVRELISESITSARTAERELWSAIPKDQSVPITNLQREFDATVADLLPEVRDQKTPKIVRDFINRVSSNQQVEQSLIILPEDIGRRVAGGAPAGTNAGEMTQLRTELLDMARQSSTSGDYNQARIYNNLAEAVLDDIDTAFRQTGNTAYQDARQFSKELNDTYTRSFVGKATSQGRYGDRIAPELLVRRATSSGPEATRLQLEELEQATRFVTERGFAEIGRAHV